MVLMQSIAGEDHEIEANAPPSPLNNNDLFWLKRLLSLVVLTHNLYCFYLDITVHNRQIPSPEMVVTTSGHHDIH